MVGIALNTATSDDMGVELSANGDVAIGIETANKLLALVRQVRLNCEVRLRLVCG